MPTTSTAGRIARRGAEDLLCRVGAYRLGRNAYQRVLNREVYARRAGDRAFFRQFVPPGGLVFDVGANEGRLTETFAELGARVVAIEPNPALAAVVQARYGSDRVTVSAVALGDSEGTADLRLGRDGGHSTLSAHWQSAVEAGGARDRWTGTVRVPVTTLDALVARFGTPDFVKIDVEGFEPQVLAGLGSPVAALSFEFLCGAIELVHPCLDHLDALATYEYGMARGESHELAPDAWGTSADVLDAIRAFRHAEPEGYGDVYARRVG